MTDKEKIKEEIEKQIDYAEDDTRYTESYREGLIAAYQTIKAFIDSLPEESGCEVNFTTKSDDLEREIGRYTTNCLLGKRNHSTGVYHLTQRNCDDIARHFAEWQKQNMKEALQTEYEKGRFDMREEMMKSLVEGEIVKNIHNQLSVKSEPLNDTFGKFGDKVKIMIVKPEQQ